MAIRLRCVKLRNVLHCVCGLWMKPISAKALKEYKKTLDRTGVTRLKRDKKFRIIDFPDYRTENSKRVSNDIGGVGHLRDPLAYRWKIGSEESLNTVREIEAKSKRVGIAYNKGGYTYLSDPKDAKFLGRK